MFVRASGVYVDSCVVLWVRISDPDRPSNARLLLPAAPLPQKYSEIPPGHGTCVTLTLLYRIPILQT